MELHVHELVGQISACTCSMFAVYVLVFKKYKSTVISVYDGEVVFMELLPSGIQTTNHITTYMYR